MVNTPSFEGNLPIGRIEYGPQTMTSMRQCLFAFLAFCMSHRLYAQTFQPTWESLDQRLVPQWYKDAKFGIFIHWGVYSVPGWSSKGQYAEWYQNGLNSGDTARIAYQKKKFGSLTY